MALVATRSAHETWAEMAPVLPPTLTGKAWSLPGLEVHHQELFAAERVPVSVAEGAAPAVGVHFCDAHLPACAAEVPLLHCHHHEVGDAKVTFTRPLPAAATLTVRRGSHAVVTERLAAGATHASVDAQHLLAMRDGIFCAFVQVLGEDGLPPSGVEARLTTAYVRPLPPSAQSEEEKRVICRALYTHYMTASLGAGVQVREAKVEALLGKCMLQWRIIAADVPPSAWPFAHVSSMAEVLDEVAAFMARWPDVPGASYSDSVWFMIDHCTNFEEFSTCAYQVGDTDTLLVPHEGDVLCGVNLFPAVDMDDLVLRVFGGPPIHLCVRNGAVRLSRPLLLCMLRYTTITLEMRGLSAYEVVFTCGLLCNRLRELVSRASVSDEWVKEQGTMTYASGLGQWTPNKGQ